MEDKKKFIDVERVISSKNKKLAKALPRFVISYLKRIIHQDEINHILTITKGMEAYEFLDTVIQYFDIKIETYGLENIPADGRYIFASNHPMGGMDGITFMYTMLKSGRKIKMILNDLLMNIENLQSIGTPINKHGSNAENQGAIQNDFMSEAAILIFPAGLVSRKTKGVIKDLDWKKTFISMSKKYQRDIVPVFIDGRNSNFFYNLANFRKLLGIKVNFEMLYLADELFKHRGKTIRFYFGEPVPYTKFDKSKKDMIWARELREHVYKLPEDLSGSFK